MFLLKKPIILAMFLISISTIILFITKPPILFKNGKTIPFGIGNDRTIFSMTIIIIILATIFSLFTNIVSFE